MNTNSKEHLQEVQYNFPYHHLTYEENGALYVFKHLFWGLEHYTYIQYVISQVLQIKYESLLDVGCGEGRIISELENKNRRSKHHGVDISEKAIRFANAFNERSSFSVHDITQSPFSEKVDTIISCEVVEHIPPEKVSLYISNIAKSLSSGGNFIVTTPTTNVPVNKKHYQHFTREMFEELLSKEFTIKKVSYLNRVNLFSKILSRLLANRFYISNSKVLNKFVLKTYRNNLLIGKSDTGSRIFVHATKI